MDLTAYVSRHLVGGGAGPVRSQGCAPNPVLYLG